MTYSKTILITGGAGFIGSHTVRHFVNKYPKYLVVNFDKLTYAGNLENLSDIEKADNYVFEKGDVGNKEDVKNLFEKHQFDGVIHLAAESHVDRSIASPDDFVQTNIVGTVNLIAACLEIWDGNYEGKLFYQVSTDEVYGSLGDDGYFTEKTPYDPKSPYSASKASADHLVRAYNHTFKIPVVLSNCSNNYGPYQFPEKLIPLMINNIKKELPLPVYGDGTNVRDWLWVGDHVKAIDNIFHNGKSKETYNIGGNTEWKNIDLVKKICHIMDEKLGRPQNYSQGLIQFVEDRKGHDKRYAIDARKAEAQLGWKPEMDFNKGLELTIDWYLNNEEWLDHVTTGTYQRYYDEQYKA
ncbi:MAG: dTDP-glucose 4,6-dehydratase [Flavobacteriales bacterium]|nr:dTDP-glucose 4,6-dehydratase [Flavobacteriales bacterium]